jgi:hypothetical protein
VKKPYHSEEIFFTTDFLDIYGFKKIGRTVYGGATIVNCTENKNGD